MLAGAIAQYLSANGVPRVMVDSLGDHTQAGEPPVSVHTEADDFAVLEGGTYNARLQIRTRHARRIVAEQTGEMVSALVLAMEGRQIDFAPPAGLEPRSYIIEGVRVTNLPTWYPTPEPGEETSSNYRLFVTPL